ncbi:speriolin-like protein [Glandiceps talaboti]
MITLPRLDNVDKQGQKEKFVGEIAFQLDRRIVAYVFGEGCSRRRYYGYTVLNIPEMVNLEWADDVTRNVLRHRFQQIVERIKIHGFDTDYHPTVIIRIINSYGMLDSRPSKDDATQCAYNETSLLDLIADLKLHPKEHQDMICLLGCLVTLSSQDNKPLLLY